VLRNYIFTRIERQLIDDYFQGNKKRDFYVLLTRIRSSYSKLKEDVELMEKILDKES